MGFFNHKLKLRVIPFSRNYAKLSDELFTTIRGKTFDVVRAQVVKVRTPNETFRAVVVEVELKEVAQISFEVLLRDVEQPGREHIKTYNDFLDCLNGLRRGHMPKATLFSEVKVITLRKL